MDSNISTVVFDLDGTLVQSHTNIYKATMYAFEKLKIVDILPEKQFYNKIGHHFEDIFADFRIVVDDFEKFIKVYKDAYFDFIDSSILYPYVEKVLDELKARNINIALLTTKGQDQADRIIDHFNLSQHFDYIMGRRLGIAHKPAPDMLLHICEKLNASPASVLMVGDTEMDILCGKNAGSRTCGVTYGYRTKEELQNLNPDFVIDELNELLKFL
ncbi:MAG: HAD family hydrolase [Melioribacteraceae bacterium]|nr:MAG: HAD family hydrolase [Melioribacteraceae bacterium]